MSETTGAGGLRPRRELDGAKAPLLLAAALRRTGRGWHCGLVLRGDDGAPRLLHLAWHHDLRAETVSGYYAWASLGLPELRTRAVMASLRELVARNLEDGLPYAVRFKHSTFSREGEWQPGDGETGLTCATFVLAALRAAGVELVDVNSWSERPEEDAQWRAWVLESLRENGAAEDYIERVEAEENAPRFKPEEVVGAAAEGWFPVQMEQAVVRAEQARRSFDEGTLP